MTEQSMPKDERADALLALKKLLDALKDIADLPLEGLNEATLLFGVQF